MWSLEPSSPSTVVPECLAVRSGGGAALQYVTLGDQGGSLQHLHLFWGCRVEGCVGVCMCREGAGQVGAVQWG